MLPNSPSSPRINKPVFKITTDISRTISKSNEDPPPLRENKWTPEEHMIFVEGIPYRLFIIIKGLQKYGRQWGLIREILPSRSTTQIRTHSQNFFVKVERIANGMDPLEFIKSKPAELFVGKHFGSSDEKPKLRSKRKDKTWPSTAKKHKKRKIESDVPLDPSISKLLNRVDHVNETKPDSNHKKSVLKGKLKAASGKEIIKPASSKSVNVPKEGNSSQSGRALEEQKAPIPYSMTPPPTVPDRLYYLFEEVSKMADEMKVEHSNTLQLMGSDPEFRYYWNSIYACSTSLQNIVNDVAYIHLSTQSAPHPMLFNAGYYPAPMAHPYMAEPRWPSSHP